MANTPLSRKALMRLVCSRLLAAVPVLCLVLFLPAGTLAYWEAWVYLAVLFIPMSFVLGYLLKHDPELLERRLHMREKEREQKLIIKLSLLYYALVFLLPGFDRRWDWSQVPIALVIVADVLVFLGYGLFILMLWCVIPCMSG
jgi:hypothetical protein